MTLAFPILSPRQQFLLLQKRDKNLRGFAPLERKFFKAICELNDANTYLSQTQFDFSQPADISPQARHTQLRELAKYQKGNAMIAELSPSGTKSALKGILRGFKNDMQKIAEMNITL